MSTFPLVCSRIVPSSYHYIQCPSPAHQQMPLLVPSILCLTIGITSAFPWPFLRDHTLPATADLDPSFKPTGRGSTVELDLEHFISDVVSDLLSSYEQGFLASTPTNTRHSDPTHPPTSLISSYAFTPPFTSAIGSSTLLPTVNNPVSWDIYDTSIPIPAFPMSSPPPSAPTSHTDANTTTITKDFLPDTPPPPPNPIFTLALNLPGCRYDLAQTYLRDYSFRQPDLGIQQCQFLCSSDARCNAFFYVKQ